MVAAIPAASAQHGGFFARILNEQNGERRAKGHAPLVWNARLASDAQAWADSLARRGAFEHAQQRGTPQGENLWRGTAGAYSPEEMIDSFLSERRYFRPGRFPNVSRTGNWHDIGHYTQIIWPATQQVGCAVARGRGNDVLVCRYWPAGNVMGQPIR